MALWCATCGKLSRDEIACEHCRRELDCGPEMPPPRCPLPGGSVALTLQQIGLLSRADNYLHLENDAGGYRAHWLGPAAWSRRQADIVKRLALRLPCLPPGLVMEEAHGAWLIFPAGEPLVVPWAGGGDDVFAELERLLQFTHSVAEAMETLHAAGLVWLNFDPLEMEWVDGRVCITNLDLQVFAARELHPLARLRPQFVAPEVGGDARDISAATDVFHLGLLVYYWIAGLLPEGFPGQGLAAFSHQIPPLRTYAPWLPPGLARVVAQAVSPTPAQRPSRPAQFVLALEEVSQRCRGRIDETAAISWEIGGHTRNGRTKTATGRDNEDQLLIRTFHSPPRALLAVADGISICDVGSGRLASWLTISGLNAAMDDGCRHEDFTARLPDACRHVAAALVEWALAKGYRQQLAEGADLMGTTLAAAWLEGRHLHVGNLGDSRVYLIDDHDVEQLTVDGDLGSTLLAQGYPPESIADLGPMARALRECIGGCQVGPEGDITIVEELCSPSIHSWPLVPGDIVVLCSDGLVEEGMFLEPATLGHMARTHRHRPAQEIAELLADAADALQRLPSAREPEGYGDNITVIVVKVLPG